MCELGYSEEMRNTTIRMIDYVLDNLDETQLETEDICILVSLQIRLKRRLPIPGEPTDEERMLSVLLNKPKRGTFYGKLG